jgi:hypothetical protein
MYDWNSQFRKMDDAITNYKTNITYEITKDLKLQINTDDNDNAFIT